MHRANKWIDRFNWVTALNRYIFMHKDINNYYLSYMCNVYNINEHLILCNPWYLVKFKSSIACVFSTFVSLFCLLKLLCCKFVLLIFRKRMEILGAKEKKSVKKKIFWKAPTEIFQLIIYFCALELIKWNRFSSNNKNTFLKSIEINSNL